MMLPFIGLTGTFPEKEKIESFIQCYCIFFLFGNTDFIRLQTIFQDKTKLFLLTKFFGKWHTYLI